MLCNLKYFVASWRVVGFKELDVSHKESLQSVLSSLREIDSGARFVSSIMIG